MLNWIVVQTLVSPFNSFYSVDLSDYCLTATMTTLGLTGTVSRVKLPWCSSLRITIKLAVALSYKI